MVHPWNIIMTETADARQGYNRSCMILPMRMCHIPEVAGLHAQALAGDFLPGLGEGFLRVLYRSILEGNLGFGWVCLQNAADIEHPADTEYPVDRVPPKVVGFVVGCEDTSRLFRQAIARAWLQLGWSVLQSLVRRPALVGRILETFFYPGKENNGLGKAELLVIAVDRENRGRGIGDALIQALNRTFWEKGIQSYKLTVLQSNQGANRFYHRLGFKMVGTFNLYGKDWNQYRFEIKQDPQIAQMERRF